MTKTQFIQALSERTSFLTKQQANLVLDSLTEIVIDTLKQEGKVIIPDIVKLTVKEKGPQPEREGRNPFTKEKITIAAKPASKRVAASPATSLKKSFGA